MAERGIPSVARNAPCPCGSGKKYKRCHGAPEAMREMPATRSSPQASPQVPAHVGRLENLDPVYMGIYQEYVKRQLDPKKLAEERKKHLARIGTLRNAEVFTYAARMGALPIPLPLGVEYDDLVPFVDHLDGLKGDRIAVILETPGGAGEIGRQMVEILHDRFRHVTFIVPGSAKSTGTIMVLGGHEILMGPGSALGPIDAQLQRDGKTYSADALIEGLNRIKREVDETGKLNPAYIPILQKLSPGEIEHAHNALEFARVTVRDWLVKYKWANWTHHRTHGPGSPVTPEEKQNRAYEISSALASQSRWHTHGRAIRIPDLRALRLEIEDFTDTPELADAIQRYFVLLRMTFESSNIFKVFETPASSASRRFSVHADAAGRPGQPSPVQSAEKAAADVTCAKCGTVTNVQVDFLPGATLEPGNVQYPNSGILACPSCSARINVSPVKAAVEKAVGRPALNPQPVR